MKKQFVLFLFCLICLSVLNIQAQIKTVSENSFQTNLPEIQANPWDLEYQIKLQNIQNPQFADVIRKRFLRNKLSLKKESDEEILQRKIYIGETRIKAGRASTTFKYNPNLTLKDYLLLKSDSYELRKIVEQNAEICLKMFRKNLHDEKLAQNDIVDASALAFVLSYEVFFGERPSKAHLNWMRKKGKEILLKLPSFQGVDNAERQRTFEIFGVLTMYAKILQERGLKGDKEALIEARETAGEVLKEVWGNSTDSILKLPVGFTHKGQKLISDNQATQFFKFNPDLLIAEKLSAGNSQTKTQYQTILNQIYKEMSLKKMPNNDLATCGTYSFAVVYPLLAETGDLNNNQLNGVYEVLKRAILNSPDIQAASDENKQIACEVFAIRAAILNKQITENTLPNDSKNLSRQFINDLFRAYGEDFRTYQMTSNNFIKTNPTTASNK